MNDLMRRPIPSPERAAFHLCGLQCALRDVLILQKKLSRSINRTDVASFEDSFFLIHLNNEHCKDKKLTFKNFF